MATKRNAQNSKTVDTYARQAEALEMCIAGTTYEDIGKHFGVTKQRAWQIVQEALAAKVAEPAEELRRIELARLDEMFRVAWAQMHTDHVLVQAGKVVTEHRLDATGQTIIDPRTDAPWEFPFIDHGPKLAAMDRLLKIAERRSKYLGLDAPTQVNVSMDAVAEELRAIATALGLDPDQLNTELEGFLANLLAENQPAET